MLDAASGLLEAETGARAVTASVRLRRKIELVISPFASACAALLTHPRLRELWPEYLILQHAIIRATVPLTQAAAEQARGLAPADPLAAPLVRYLEEHIEEERDHDEDLLNDLELLGVDPATVLGRMPPPAVATLVGCQYYWLRHHHPLALLGYIALMEGYPPSPELVETLITRTGYRREAFRTFAEHAQLDPQHRQHLDETLDLLPLTAEHEAVLGVSAITTTALATRALEEMLAG